MLYSYVGRALGHLCRPLGHLCQIQQRVPVVFCTSVRLSAAWDCRENPWKVTLQWSVLNLAHCQGSLFKETLKSFQQQLHFLCTAHLLLTKHLRGKPVRLFGVQLLALFQPKTDALPIIACLLEEGGSRCGVHPHEEGVVL